MLLEYVFPVAAEGCAGSAVVLSHAAAAVVKADLETTGGLFSVDHTIWSWDLAPGRCY